LPPSALQTQPAGLSNQRAVERQQQVDHPHELDIPSVVPSKSNRARSNQRGGCPGDPSRFKEGKRFDEGRTEKKDGMKKERKRGKTLGGASPTSTHKP